MRSGKWSLDLTKPKPLLTSQELFQWSCIVESLIGENLRDSFQEMLLYLRQRKEEAKQGIRWHHLYYITSMPSLGARLGDLSLVGAVLPGAVSLALPKETALDSWLSSLWICKSAKQRKMKMLRKDCLLKESIKRKHNWNISCSAQTPTLALWNQWPR